MRICVDTLRAARMYRISANNRTGAITAGKVIEVVGTTFGEDAWKDIYRLVSKVKHEKYLF